MESLFKITNLESRTSLNMNVLDATRTPRVMDLREVIQAFLDHRRIVLQRRSRQRLGKIVDRMEILEGYRIAFLKVIRIIRFEDEPKKELISAFKLTDRQADAILNMRLRALNKLQEIEIKTEFDKLAAEKAEIETTFAEAPELDIDFAEAFIEKQPVTVVLSDKGWIRAMKGHVSDTGSIKFKDGDSAAFIVPCQTTDKIILFASNGKFYTIGADKLPGGRGNGEPIRLMIDLENDHMPIGMFLHNPERKLLIASTDGYGFRVNESDIVASTKGGRKTLNVKGDAEAVRCIEVTGEKIATIGENRKILIFDIEELPEMGRGKGVRLQKYKDGGLADVTTFTALEGLSFVDSSGRTNSVADWNILEGKRAGAGRMAPRGFSRQGVFAPDKRLK